MEFQARWKDRHGEQAVFGRIEAQEYLKHLLLWCVLLAAISAALLVMVSTAP